MVDYLSTSCPNTVAVTFDAWSDKYRRRSYLTLTLHYICKNFQMINLTLATNHFPDRHKGIIVLPHVESILDCFGLCEKKIHMVTDAGNAYYLNVLFVIENFDFWILILLGTEILC